MNLWEAQLESLQRMQMVLGIHLQGALDDANVRYGWTNDRALRFPSRIDLNTLPSLDDPNTTTALPVVNLRWTGSANPRRDITGHEDNIATLEVSVLHTGSTTRTIEDIQARTETYANLVCDIIRTYARKGCSSEGWGLFDVEQLSSARAQFVAQKEHFFVKATAQLRCFVRYRNPLSYTTLPKLPHTSPVLPLGAAPTLPLTYTATGLTEQLKPFEVPFEVVSDITINPPFPLQVVWLGQVYTIPMGSPWTPFEGPQLLIGQGANGIQATWSIIYSPTPTPTLFTLEDDSQLLLEDGSPFALE